MLIVDEGLTAEQYRAHPEFRQALDAFLKTEAGAHMLYILSEGSQPVTKELSFPQDRLEELHASEHRKDMGWRKAVVMLKNLSKPLPTAEASQKVDPAMIGAKRTKEDLDKRVPEFVVPASSTKPTPPTT